MVNFTCLNPFGERAIKISWIKLCVNLRSSNFPAAFWTGRLYFHKAIWFHVKNNAWHGWFKPCSTLKCQYTIPSGSLNVTVHRVNVRRTSFDTYPVSFTVESWQIRLNQQYPLRLDLTADYTDSNKPPKIHVICKSAVTFSFKKPIPSEFSPNTINKLSVPHMHTVSIMD